MCRPRRCIKSKCAYEICFRARQGLPLVANYLMRFILACTLARVQRDSKVILCHHLWNGSHAHIFVVCLDSQQFYKFYMELEKKLTDIIKRLLGYRWLNIWEDRPTVMYIDDIAMAVERISYIYANPAQDNLEIDIDRFPGYSSWRHFLNRKNHLNETNSEMFPWLRLRTIPKLEDPAPSDHECRLIARLLRRRNKDRFALVQQPNAWMKSFGVTSNEEVEIVNQRIENRIREREATAERIRVAENKTVMGAARLLEQPIMKPHAPKKHGGKVFILSSYKEARLALIKEYKSFCDRCKDCYERWKIGDLTVVWPLGAFKPPMPVLCNLIPCVD